MTRLGDELALAGKPTLELAKEIVRDALVYMAMNALGMGAGRAPQQARIEPVPIRIEVVMAGQKAVDTIIALPVEAERKRFPARTYVVPIAPQKQMARPMLVK